jgi:hypothetical protein
LIDLSATIKPPKAGLAILTLDIEVSPHVGSIWGLFNQNISLSQLRETSTVICWAAKYHGKQGVEFRSDHHDGHAAQIKRMRDLLDEAEIVVGYNHAAYDLKHLNREFWLADLKPPSPYKKIDLLLEIRRQFKFASHKLQHIAEEVGIGEKIKNSGMELWHSCVIENDPKAWEKMRTYNRMDTILTERLLDKAWPWLKLPNMALYMGIEDLACTACGSKRVVKRGFSVSNAGKFQRYVCKDCDKFSVSPKRIATTELRPVS